MELDTLKKGKELEGIIRNSSEQLRVLKNAAHQVNVRKEAIKIHIDGMEFFTFPDTELSETAGVIIKLLEATYTKMLYEAKAQLAAL